jgi:CP family cyanate transporter-like MFS transporter
MVLAGIGSGMFPLALTLIGLRARTSATTGVLSAFVQSIGYIVAGTGPLLFGVLHDAAGGWGLPLGLLFAALGVALVSGWLATGPNYVDDEVGRPVADTAG